MRQVVVVVVLATMLLVTAAAASALSMIGSQTPRFGTAAAGTCDLTEVEVIAQYYIQAPKTGYYTAFKVRGSGSKAGCDDFTVYVRIAHDNHYYYLKIDAADVPVTSDYAVLGVFAAEPGDPLVYATDAYDPNHVVSQQPTLDHSIFDETRVLVSNAFPASF